MERIQPTLEKGIHMMPVRNEQTVFTIINDENFDTEVLKSPIPVVVEFGARWCGTCHIIAPIIHKLALRFKEQIKVCKLDIDSNEKVSNNYAIHQLPTLLFFKYGQVVDCILQAVPEKVIAEKFEVLLEINEEAKSMTSAVQRDGGLERK